MDTCDKKVKYDRDEMGYGETYLCGGHRNTYHADASRYNVIDGVKFSGASNNRIRALACAFPRPEVAMSKAVRSVVGSCFLNKLSRASQEDDDL